jgi:hypothetical protein
MTAILLAIAAAAAWYLFGQKAAAPKLPAPAADLFRVPPQVAQAVPPVSTADPRPALDQILRVRETLKETGRLNDDNAKAVDLLVLELVHGKAEAK